MALIIFNHWCYSFFSRQFTLLTRKDWYEKMDVVVDIQFLKGVNNIAVPKEVAIVALDNDFIGHWLVTTKYPIHKLSNSIRRENNWLTKHHHGLDYFDGDVSESKLYKILRELAKRLGKIYVRGNEKWLLLQKITAREIINLEYDTECPPFDKLSCCDNFCFHHAIKIPHLKYTCALNNAFRLKSWLSTTRTKYKRIEDFDYTFQSPLQICDEQSGSFEDFVPHTISYCGGVPSRPDPAEVDETDSICSEH